MTIRTEAVFLDRDGVVNRQPAEGGYITSPEELLLLPGAADAIRRLNHGGFRVFLVTNQSCIGRGLVAAQTVEEIHARLLQHVHDSGGKIEHVYVCPHDDGDACECRKPKPGMLLQASREHSLRLQDCWMVGDRASDITAGRVAGCRTVAVAGFEIFAAEFTAANLARAVEYILAESGLLDVPD